MTPDVKPTVNESVMLPWSKVDKGFGRGRGRGLNKPGGRTSLGSSSVEQLKSNGLRSTMPNFERGSVNVNISPRFQDVDVVEDGHDPGSWKTVNHGRQNVNRGRVSNKTGGLYKTSNVSNGRGRNTSDVLIGKRTDSSVIKCAQPRPITKKRAVFLSRLCPEVTVKNIEQFVKEEIDPQNLRCTQIKTKFEGYASFHVEVGEEDFEKVMSADMWPEGCLIAPFKGLLRKDLHLNSSNEDDAFLATKD